MARSYRERRAGTSRRPGSRPAAMPIQGAQAAAEVAVLALQPLDPLLLVGDHAVQRLDGRQRDTVRVDRVVGPVVVAETEAGAEILRHGAEVADAVGLGAVGPKRDRQAADPAQDLAGVGGGDVLLLIAVADAQGGAALRAGLLIRGG